MKIDLFKKILIDNRRLISQIDFIERNIVLEDNLNYVFVGLRQAGKSYLMYQRIHQLLKMGHTMDEIIYVNLDDERLYNIALEDLDLILQAHYQLNDCKPIIFLDEIQNISHWEHFARRLANEQYRVYLTGSNAKMLSSEVATTLGGRYMIQEVYPYSLSEYLKANELELQKNWEYDSAIVNHIHRLFSNYFYYGGFPESVHVREKRSWLSVLYQKIFLGDLIARYKIRNEVSLKLLVKKLSESINQPSSFNRLANIVSSAGQKIQTSTVIDYMQFMEESWLIFSMENYAAKFVEKESAKKYYFRDNGILNLFLIDPETALLENRVAIELKKHFGGEVYFYNKNVEVDFYVPQHDWLIQVTYSIANDDTREREISSLLKVAKHLQAKRLTIITYNEEHTISLDNGSTIEVIPLWKWLLER
jgi:predicted AAA+ superfamily ATPase